MKSVLTLIVISFFAVAHAAEPAKPKWQIAKEILDDHFDDDASLREAAKVLVQARTETPKDPNLYVQAARLTIKGGDGFAPALRRGPEDAYAYLLDEALKLDPNHKKALILRAEAYSLVGDLANERRTLRQAKEAAGVDRWLEVGFARHSRAIRDSSSEFAAYAEIEKLGPGDSRDQKNAYVFALSQIVLFRPSPGETFRLKELAQLAKKYQSPKDYRTPAAFAQEFLFHGLYTEAIEFSQVSTSIRPTRNARLILASALYGDAAILLAEGKESDAKKRALEAKALGFPKEMIQNRLPGPSSNFSKALPYLDELFK